MKKIVIVIAFIFYGFLGLAQIPQGYYDSAYYLSGVALKTALHNIIKNHTSINYSGLWTAFQTTDDKTNGKVWDIYSDIPGGTPPYEFTFVSDQCGSYSAEGDCYNREHSFPESWFGSGSYPMYSDLFQIYPTDGYVNNRRGNFPYGDVGSATWTSQNGSKLGACTDAGYTGTVFEPIDEYKGDIARTYFYMAVRYFTEDSGWPGSDMVTGAEPDPWAINMLLSWHQQDSVSQKEIDRNNTIYYNFQHNRNPFIDHPEWVWNIWGSSVDVNQQELEKQVLVCPNPASDKINIKYRTDKTIDRIEIYSITSSLVYQAEQPSPMASIDVRGLTEGFYTLMLYSSDEVSHTKFIVIRK